MLLRNDLKNPWTWGLAARVGPLGIVLFLGIHPAPLASAIDHKYLGMQFGMSQADVVHAFKDKGIPTEQTRPDMVSAPRTLVLLSHVNQVRLHFNGGKLDRITVNFEIPPMESTAARLLAMYRAEQRRLSDLFGSPREDTAVMNAPSIQDRHEWIARARGYYRSVWVTDEKVEIKLWLYGSDDGIVLMEVYEKEGSSWNR